MYLLTAVIPSQRNLRIRCFKSQKRRNDVQNLTWLKMSVLYDFCAEEIGKDEQLSPEEEQQLEKVLTEYLSERGWPGMNAV